MIYALPPMEFLRIAHGWRWVECGAGTGLWIRIMQEDGIDVVGYDKVPRGENVRYGDHTHLADHSDRALLIVWPPDGADLPAWLACHNGTHVALCGDFGRFASPLPDYPILNEWRIPDGPKGTSVMRFMQVR